jgi:hypothetical protein
MATKMTAGALVLALASMTACDSTEDAQSLDVAAGDRDSGAEESDSGAPEEGPLYLASTWIATDEMTNTYVAVIDSLEGDELDLSNPLEIGGYGDAWVSDGAVFVADGESPTVTRYTLDDDGQLEAGDTLDFSAYGVTGAAFYDNDVLSPTKAYLANVSGLEYVVWNPTTMEITGTAAWPEIDFGEGLMPFHSYTDRGGAVVDGLYFHGIYAHDEDFFRFGDHSLITVWDIETDELVDMIEVPCPMMDVASVGDDGYLYVSGWSYMPLSFDAGYSEVNCAARIDLETRELDQDWLLDYSEALDGEQGSGLRAVSGHEGIFAVFHGSGVEVVDNIDIWELDVGDDDWELYSIDLDTRDVEPTGVLFSDGSYYESHVDGDYYVYLGAGTQTQVYQRTGGAYVKKLKAAGWMSRLFRLR